MLTPSKVLEWLAGRQGMAMTKPVIRPKAAHCGVKTRYRWITAGMTRKIVRFLSVNMNCIVLPW